MHIIRAISAIAIFAVAICYSSRVLGTIHLNDVMSSEEQKKTGVSKLTDTQKKELEQWLNDKFVLKTPIANSQSLTLQQNVQNGSQLIFSDGSVYEIAPTDRSHTSFWLTPISVTIEPNTDPNYPYMITNTLTGQTVKAKLIKSKNAELKTG